jgi:thioredoxin 1
MKKIFKLSFLFLFISTLSSSDSDLSDLYPVGDISIKSLFEIHEGFETNYWKYETNNLFDPLLFKDIEIYVFFATWCHDSKREVPRLLRLLNKLDVPENHIHLIGLNFMKNDLQNRGQDFKVKKTPTFILLRNNKEIGRIVEKPDISLETDLLKILSSVN